MSEVESEHSIGTPRVSDRWFKSAEQPRRRGLGAEGRKGNIDQSMALSFNHSVSIRVQLNRFTGYNLSNRKRKQIAEYNGIYIQKLEIWNKKFHLHYALARANRNQSSVPITAKQF